MTKKTRKKPLRTVPEGLCEQLIEHMSNGGSFRSFAGVCNINYEQLRRWSEKHKGFREAKSMGESKSLGFFERERNAASLGRLNTIKKEIIKSSVFLDENGKPIKDEKGKPVVREEVIQREYQRTDFKEASWIFIMKSRFNYTDFVPVGPLNVDPDATASEFKLSYPSGPLVPHNIKDKEGEKSGMQSVSNEQEKQEAVTSG